MQQSILFLIVVFLSNVIQSITGFAGTVLAMPFSVMLIGYNGARAILNALGLAASVGVDALEFRHINFKVRKDDRHNDPRDHRGAFYRALSCR